MTLSGTDRRVLQSGLANRVTADRIADTIDFALANTTGTVFYVHSGTGSDAAGSGKSKDSPFATIDYAVALCTASKGDFIIVMPGHVEDLAAATIDVDVVGVTIVGLGTGTDRPRIDFNNAASSFVIGANNVTIVNLTFQPSVSAVLIGIEVETLVLNTRIIDCEFLPGEDAAGVDEFVVGIDLKVGVDGTIIDGVKYRDHSGTDHLTACISLTGASDNITIQNCNLQGYGAALLACISGITTLSTNVLIQNNLLTADAEPCIELLTGTTGIVANNFCFTDLGTILAAIVADGCALFENYYVESGNEGGAYIGTLSVDD